MASTPGKHLPPVPVLGSTPYNFLSESPDLVNWKEAVRLVLSREFRREFHNFESAHEEFKRHLATLNVQEREKFADRMRDRVRKRYYRLEGANPSYNYSEEEKRNLRAGKAARPGMQLEHMEDVKTKIKHLHPHKINIQGAPERALDPANIYRTLGGPKGTQPIGTPHQQKYHKLLSAYLLQPGRYQIVGSTGARPAVAPGAASPATPNTIGTTPQGLPSATNRGTGATTVTVASRGVPATPVSPPSRGASAPSAALVTQLPPVPRNIAGTFSPLLRTMAPHVARNIFAMLFQMLVQWLGSKILGSYEEKRMNADWERNVVRPVEHRLRHPTEKDVETMQNFYKAFFATGTNECLFLQYTVEVAFYTIIGPTGTVTAYGEMIYTGGYLTRHYKNNYNEQNRVEASFASSTTYYKYVFSTPVLQPIDIIFYEISELSRLLQLLPLNQLKTFDSYLQESAQMGIAAQIIANLASTMEILIARNEPVFPATILEALNSARPFIDGGYTIFRDDGFRTIKPNPSQTLADQKSLVQWKLFYNDIRIRISIIVSHLQRFSNLYFDQLG